VHRILKEERDIVISWRPLEATAFEIDNTRIAYVFYENGLSINVMYTVDDPGMRAVGFKPNGWTSRPSSPRGSSSRSRGLGWPEPFAVRTSPSRTHTEPLRTLQKSVPSTMTSAGLQRLHRDVSPPSKEETVGKLIVTEFVTLDGVAQAPGGPDEDRDGDFAYGGWQAPLVGEGAGGVVFEEASRMDALLLGRRTYDIFANYWPKAPPEIPFTALLNGIPKYVASRALAEPLAWQGSTLVADDLAASITALKDRNDEVHVIGSLDLVQSLLRFRLVDRMNLWLYPVLLGSGKQVFGGGTVPTAMRLIESVTYPNGSVHLVYETAGVPTYGDMATEDDAASHRT
jgi:dihydrofolate reductase